MVSTVRVAIFLAGIFSYILTPATSFAADGAAAPEQPAPAAAPQAPVEPLDAWENVSPEPPKTSDENVQLKKDLAESLSKRLSLGDYSMQELAPTSETPAEAPVEEAPTPIAPIRPIVPHAKLNSFQKERLAKARSYLRVRAIKYQANTARANMLDNRGPVELRVCSADLNGYRIISNWKRHLPTPLNEMAAREKSFVASVTDCACDVVAVQGVLGKRTYVAETAFEHLRDKLSDASGAAWSSWVGIGTARLFNGFLVRDSQGVAVTKSWMHSDKQLSIGEEKKSDSFVSAPFELTAQVTNPADDSTREVRILSFDLRKQLEPTKQKNIPYTTAAAEMIHRLAVGLQFDAHPENYPLTLLAGVGDRGRSFATRFLIEGRVTPDDLGTDKPCTISPTERLKCSAPLNHPPELYPVINEGKSAATTKAHFFLLQSDLRYAKERDLQSEKFALGSCPFENGTRNGSISWVDLNW